jgi:hypothetical protein
MEWTTTVVEMEWTMIHMISFKKISWKSDGKWNGQQ